MSEFQFQWTLLKYEKDEMVLFPKVGMSEGQSRDPGLSVMTININQSKFQL